MTVLLAQGFVILLALMGLPLFLVLAALALLGYLDSGQSVALFFASNIRPVATNPIFLAIPLFTLAGYLMAESGAPNRIVRLSRAAVGWMPGGLAIVALVACAGFTAFTGASGVTIVALGGLLMPALLKDGYPDRFALGLLTTGGSRGLLFPPSLPLIVYAMIAGLAMEGASQMRLDAGPASAEVASETPARSARSDVEKALDDELDRIMGEREQEVREPQGEPKKSDEAAGEEIDVEAEVAAMRAAPPAQDSATGTPEVVAEAPASGQAPAQVSVDRLFVAGALPGAFALTLVGLYTMFIGVRQRVPRSRFDGRELARAIRSTAWELPIPLIIVVGIYGGFFTAIDAAAIVAAYVFVVEVLIYRDIAFRALGRIFRESMVLVGGILLILMSALALTNYFIDREVPQKLFALIRDSITSPFTFLLILNGFLLVVGCLMDIFSAILVVVPIITPIALHYGIDPIHLGIVFLTNLEIGFSTPPVGVNLFVGALAFRRPVVELYRATLPFLAISLIALIAITYWPDLSLFLVRWTGVR